MARVVVSHRVNGLVVLIFLALLAGFAHSVKAQQPNPLTRLKRAVVIVTTYDDHGSPLLQGSGFFIAPERVVTNLHVIKQARSIHVETFAGRKVPVTSVAATDEDSDLALLQIGAPSPGAETLELEYTAPVAGDPIFVVSNPQGAHWKTTRGRVGAMWNLAGTGRRLQITASLRPGSSGGPVLNQQGRVIGIAAMHLQSAEELDFAVPAENLKVLQALAGVASSRPIPRSR